MAWHILTSIVFTQQALHTRVWISLHITQKLLLYQDYMLDFEDKFPPLPYGASLLNLRYQPIILS
jgi:hypothetical protein